MPGFDLARVVADRFPKEAGPNTLGMILLNHGLFSFGDTARESYERMIELVSLAEAYLDSHGATNAAPREPILVPGITRAEIASLRRDVSEAAGHPMILTTHRGPREMAFVQRPDLRDLANEGVATPDHVIRTKRIPQIGPDVSAFQKEYEQYFQEHAARSKQPLQMLDPAPRVILDPEMGMVTTGKSAREASIAFDVYSQTIDIVEQATALGGYRALPAADIFAVEYWDLEQAKLRRSGPEPVFAGEVALITGAASGIGKASAEAFLRRGAAVVGVDVDPKICDQFGERRDFHGVRGDITNVEDIDRTLEALGHAFGGLDMLVLNAGIFGASRRIEALSLAEWRTLMSVNLDANMTLKLAPRRGRVVVIGSKNVPAPGPGAAAYSASKAALNQLARVAALEWGADGIRVNVVHPNAVFDTGIWTEEVLHTRAASYGMSVEQYRTNNVLRVEVTSRDVAEMVAEMCGPLFAKTTAAQVPIDGGNERVI
jgi:NAD(P)-dependent dehydrogenase (short-subunit alcohol dehydrogenase family)/ribulose-5-phosphate 4-epimerase/fuculose-1-phosphate aldolase